MLKKIPANKLTTGMYLHEVCGSWLKSPFWRKAFLLQDVNDIKAIHDSGVKEVVIDTAKGRDITSEVEVNEQSIETTVHADESALHVNESNKQKKRPPNGDAPEPFVIRLKKLWCKCFRMCAWVRWSTWRLPSPW